MMMQLTGRHIRLHNSTSDEDIYRLFRSQEFVTEFVTIKNKVQICTDPEQMKQLTLALVKLIIRLRERKSLTPAKIFQVSEVKKIKKMNQTNVPYYLDAEKIV